MFWLFPKLKFCVLRLPSTSNFIPSTHECKTSKLQFCCLNINLFSMKIYTAVMDPILLHLEKSIILQLHIKKESDKKDNFHDKITSITR